jgi:hypothetical protein
MSGRRAKLNPRLRFVNPFFDIFRESWEQAQKMPQDGLSWNSPLAGQVLCKVGSGVLRLAVSTVFPPALPRTVFTRRRCAQ